MRLVKKNKEGAEDAYAIIGLCDGGAAIICRKTGPDPDKTETKMNTKNTSDPSASFDAQKSNENPAISEEALAAVLATPKEMADETPKDKTAEPEKSEPAKDSEHKKEGEDAADTQKDGKKRETDPEPIGDDVLQGMNPHTQRKVQKRIDKLTAEKYELKQRLEALEAKVADGQLQKNNDLSEIVKTADEDRLRVLENNAQYMLDWYEDGIESGEHKLEGRILEADEARRLRNTAREILRTHIPARRRALAEEEQLEREKALFDEKVSTYFPEYNDENSDDGKWMRETYEESPALQKMPNGKFLVCLARIGMKAVNAGLAAKKAAGKHTESAPITHQPDGIPTAGTAAPKPKARTAIDERIARKESLSPDQLAAFLSQKH